MSAEKQSNKSKSWFKNPPVGVMVAIITGIFLLISVIIPLLDNRDKTIVIKLAPTDTPLPDVTDTATLLLAILQTQTQTFVDTLTPAPQTLESNPLPTNTPTVSPAPQEPLVQPPASPFKEVLSRISMAAPPAEFVISPDNAADLTQWISIPIEYSPNDVAFSPDGKQLAVAATSILFYDLQTMQVTRELTTDEPTEVMVFSPDWALMATLHPYPGIFRMWSLPTGRVLQSFTYKDTKSIAFSPDGKLLAAVVGQVVMILDSENGSVLTQLVADGLVTAQSVAFSPDGKILACGGFGVFLWDTTTWQQMPQVIGHDWADHLTFSPDGTKLAVIVNGQSAKVFEIPNGNELYAMDMGSMGLAKTSSVYAGVAFSPDSQLLALAMGGSSTFKLWAMNDGHELRQLIGHTQTVQSVAFSANGTALATISDDQTLQLWSLAAR